jgi:hypothetical protein
MQSWKVVSTSLLDSDFFLSVGYAAEAVETPNFWSDIVDVKCGRIVREMEQEQDKI